MKGSKGGEEEKSGLRTEDVQDKAKNAETKKKKKKFLMEWKRNEEAES